MFKITGYYFTSKYVIYSSVVNDPVLGTNRFCSIHDRSELTDEQAKHRFKSKHNQEVRSLIIEALKNENNKSKTNHSGSILQPSA